MNHAVYDPKYYFVPMCLHSFAVLHVLIHPQCVLQELVASTPNQRNWRGILIALLVIVAVLGLIVFSIVLLSPPEEGPRVKGRKFTLEDVLGPHYRARRFNGTWVSGECRRLSYIMLFSSTG